MDRLFPLDLFVGHFKVLVDRNEDGTENRRWIRPLMLAIIYGIPVCVGAIAFSLATTLHAPGALLAGASLLSGGALSAFTHLSSLRQKLTDRSASRKASEESDRNMMDESATHLLMCSVAAMLTATSIVIGMLTSHAANAEYNGVLAGMSIGFACWTGLIFWVAVPRLYTAYVQIHEVPDRLNGTHMGPPTDAN